MSRKAFTLIELLVVIAIIAILAAILFPVFAQAKESAKRAADVSNSKELGIATYMYLTDYDDYLYPHRFNCKDGGGNFVECDYYANHEGQTAILDTGTDDGTTAGGSSRTRLYWIYLLQPYAKNAGIFRDPSNSAAFSFDTQAQAPVCGNVNGGDPKAVGCVGHGYGGQNSYGHNDGWLSPAGAFAGAGGAPQAISSTSIPRPASTAMLVDATYYGASLDAANMTGHLQNQSPDPIPAGCSESTVEACFLDKQGSQYKFYWKNIGFAQWSFTGGEAGPYAGTTPSSAGVQKALTEGQRMHAGNIVAQFADTHSKTIPYNRMITDVCLWSTDQDGTHPNCQ